jgi:hypothetical protein
MTMPRFAIAFLIALAALGPPLTDVHAQEASPAAGGCPVTPRTDSELISLNATAESIVATPIARAPVEFPTGEPIDASILAALDETLSLVTGCARSGDLARLLALYSDAYVSGIALAPEPEPIVPGQGYDHAGGPVATPSSIVVAPFVEMAVRLPDGRVAALVSTGRMSGVREVVIFVEERGRWVIDDVRATLPEGPIGGDLPFPVQAAVASAVANRGVPPESVTVVRYETVDWADSSLGCPEEGGVYAQVITPGYLVVLSIAGEEVEYHTDALDRAVECDAS